MQELHERHARLQALVALARRPRAVDGALVVAPGLDEMRFGVGDARHQEVGGAVGGVLREQAAEIGARFVPAAEAGKRGRERPLVFGGVVLELERDAEGLEGLDGTPRPDQGDALLVERAGTGGPLAAPRPGRGRGGHGQAAEGNTNERVEQDGPETPRQVADRRHP